MKKRLFLGVLLASVFMGGCSSKEEPVETEAVKLKETRKQIDDGVSNPAVQTKLLALTTQLEQQVKRLNDFDANGLSRVALLSADYKTTDSALLQANQTFRLRRGPLQSRIADTLFEMKAATPAAEWPALGRVAFNDAVNNMVIKKIQPEA
jgi:hypothetical protein